MGVATTPGEKRAENDAQKSLTGMLTSPGALAAKMKGHLLTTVLTLVACCPTTPAERAEPVAREPSVEAAPSVAQAPAPVAADLGPTAFTLRGETFTLGKEHHVGASLTGESCTECEGHEIMQLVLNAKGQIVALGVFLSG